MLTGWGRTSPTGATTRTVTDEAEVVEAIERSGRRGVLARGLGRSYGDSAQDAGGVVLDMTGLAGFAREGVTLRAQAGASLDAILRAIVPAGYFVPVTPGTRFVTVGGAIAADIHGKNHHVEGSFGHHVRRMRVVTGSGEVLECTPDTHAEEFWSTVGGMGLTGVVTEADVDLLPIETSRMRVDTERHGDLDSLMAAMVEGDHRYRYSVAWVDSIAPTGRGVLTRGDHASYADLPAGVDDGRAYDPRARVSAPAWVPGGLLNRASVRAFNEAWFRRAPRRRVGELQSIPAFFHPLDGVRDWNRIYGRRGFLQYQFVVPDAASALVGDALRRLRDAGAPSFLTVLKRFGPGSPAPLSFPMQGWTLTADVPAGIAGLGDVLDALDAEVIAAGGRHYLAKDSRMSASTLAAGYPRLAQWQATRARMDPRGVFRSDQARRLSLTVGSTP
jgi:decaprenylphospho-beta-D-ribofuranose 2-oxidase